MEIRGVLPAQSSSAVNPAGQVLVIDDRAQTSHPGADQGDGLHVGLVPYPVV